MINLHGQEAVTNFLTTLVHRHFRKCRRKNDLWWWLHLIGNFSGQNFHPSHKTPPVLVSSLCLVSRVTGTEMPHLTLATHLGHNVTLPCLGSDHVVFQGGKGGLVTDGTNFFILEASPEDEGGTLK